MMGSKDPEGKLFYQFSLESRVPDDHLLRRVAATVDFSFVRRMTKRFYSHTGQPSVDPVVIFKMALVGYLYGITSERRLVQEISLNLAYMWFIGYDLDEPMPNHSVLSKARQRFGPTTYLAFFKEIVQQCERAGLIRGNKVYVDSTLVEANTDSDSFRSRALLAQLPDIARHVTNLWQDNPDSPTTKDEPRGVSAGPRPSDSKAMTNGVRAMVPETGQSDGSTLAVPQPDEGASVVPASALPEQREQSMDGEAAPRSTGCRPSLHLARPGDVPNKAVGLLNERMVSVIDPEAELVQRARVPGGLYYKIHVGVDAGRARIITAVEATGGAVADEHLLRRIISEHEGNVGRELAEVVADTKYGTLDNYQRLEELGIWASIPMHDNGAQRRAVPASAFSYDEATDSFVCPRGEKLTRCGTTRRGEVHTLVSYRTRPKQCANCPSKAGCCGKAKLRSITRAQDGGLRQRTVMRLETFEAKQSLRRRKVWVETIFGDGKERRGMRRARCRGVDWMRIQAWMIAIAQNVRQLAVCKGKWPENGAGALEKGSPTTLFLLLTCSPTGVGANGPHLAITAFLN